jgi:hypothetical protein
VAGGRTARIYSDCWPGVRQANGINRLYRAACEACCGNLKIWEPSQHFVWFQVLTAASIKRAFWDTAPCSLVGADRRLRGAYCLHIRAMLVHHPGDGGSSNTETSVYYNETTRRFIPESCHFHLSIWLKRAENQDSLSQDGRSQDLPDAFWIGKQKEYSSPLMFP